MEVYKEPCKNCLLSKDRIVSPARAKDIVNDCLNNDTYFICHKASMNAKEVCCSKFFKAHGPKINLVRIAARLGVLKFVDQPDQEYFKPYSKNKQ